jgi:hypothetical protein
MPGQIIIYGLEPVNGAGALKNSLGKTLELNNYRMFTFPESDWIHSLADRKGNEQSLVLGYLVELPGGYSVSTG